MSGLLFQVGGKVRRGQPQQQGVGRRGNSGIYASYSSQVNSKNTLGEVASLLQELYNKVTWCPAGKTKPNIPVLNGTLQQAKDTARKYISTLRNVCPETGSTGSSGSSGSTEQKFPDITALDVDTLYKKLDKKLSEYDTTLTELETQIDTSNSGAKTALPSTTPIPVASQGKPLSSEDQIIKDRLKSYDERIRTLQRDVGTLKEEVKAIVSFVQKGSKETTPFIANYYKSLLAIQSSLTGIVSTDTTSSYFPTGRESDDRLGRLAKDVTGRLISLKLDLKYADKDAAKAQKQKEANLPAVDVYFITKTDIQDQSALKEYLTSSKPYYYFDIEGSTYVIGDSIIHNKLPGTITAVTGTTYTIAYDDTSKTAPANIAEKDLTPTDILKPTGVYRRYREKDTYRSIEAINGAGFLEVVKQYTRIKSTPGITEEDIFTFEQDICQYLFRLPKNTTTFSFKDILTSESIQQQLSYLAVIHQMHFIGTLLKKQTTPIQASINPSGTDDAEEAELDKNKNETEQHVKDLLNNISNIKIDLNTKKNDLVYAQQKIKESNIPTQSWSEYMSKTPTIHKENKDAEAAIKDYENRIKGYKKELAPYKTQVNGYESEKNKLLKTIQANITDRNKVRSLVEQKGTIQKNIDNLTNGEIARLESAIKMNNDAMNGLINTYMTNGLFIGFFKLQEICLEEIKKLEEDISNYESELTDSQIFAQQASDILDEFKKQNNTENEVYIVPEFHPVSTSGMNSIDDALKRMFVKKYKYTELFNLSDTITITDIDSINACIKLLFKYAHNPTFSIQTLEKVQTMLQPDAGPSVILPPPGVSETEAASKPGTTKKLTEKDIDLEKEQTQLYGTNKEEEYIRQLQSTIIQLAHVFLVGQESFLAEAGIEKGKETKDPSVINKIDSATQRAIASLRTDSSKSAYDKKLAETRYAQIKDLINQYKRVKIDTL